MDETTTEDGTETLPVIGSYLVRITVRGEAGQAPSATDVANACQGAALSLIKSGEATVTARAERTDR